MSLELKETRLPGVGVKWSLVTASGSRLTVIQHNDGDREVYVHRRSRDEDPAVVLELHDDEARQLGALLGGAYERPKIVEELEMALGEFQSLHDGFRAIGVGGLGTTLPRCTHPTGAGSPRCPRHRPPGRGRLQHPPHSPR